MQARTVSPLLDLAGRQVLLKQEWEVAHWGR